MDDAFSSYRTVKSVVPQGTSHGPLLFTFSLVICGMKSLQRELYMLMILTSMDLQNLPPRGPLPLKACNGMLAK